MRYELIDHEWAAIRPMLPNKPRGVPRVSHQKEIGRRCYASVRIFTGLATWSSGSSIRSSTVAV
jgi:transposase